MIRLPRRTAFLLAGLLAALCSASATGAQSDIAPKKVSAEVQAKLDDGIEPLESSDERHLVFVRMKDQMFASTADYLAFCKKHQGAKRRELRGKIIADLKQRSDASWKKVRKLVVSLGGKPESDAEEAGDAGIADPEEGEGVDQVKRYWLINGFGCSATYEACLKLAAHPDVAFVYRNQTPFHIPPAHDEPHSVAAKRFGGAYQSLARQRNEMVERFIEMWDATREAESKPFDPQGMEVPWNLQQTGADKVWTQEHVTGKGIVVGVMDTGMLPSPALVQALWRNPKEKYDDEDSDGNGFVDDLFGYDFFFKNGAVGSPGTELEFAL